MKFNRDEMTALSAAAYAIENIIRKQFHAEIKEGVEIDQHDIENLLDAFAHFASSVLMIMMMPEKGDPNIDNKRGKQILNEIRDILNGFALADSLFPEEDDEEEEEATA